jgi:hypothetical protein
MSEQMSSMCLRTWGYFQTKRLTTWLKLVPMASHLTSHLPTTTCPASCEVMKSNGTPQSGLPSLRPHQCLPWLLRPQGHVALHATQIQSAIVLMALTSVLLTTESRVHLPFSSLTPVPRSARSPGCPGHVYISLMSFSSLFNIIPPFEHLLWTLGLHSHISTCSSSAPKCWWHMGPVHACLHLEVLAVF